MREPRIPSIPTSYLTSTQPLIYTHLLKKLVIFRLTELPLRHHCTPLTLKDRYSVWLPNFKFMCPREAA